MNQPHIRVHADSGDGELWLEPCEGDKLMGLCIGSGDTLADAIMDAREGLTRALAQLDDLEKRAL